MSPASTTKLAVVQWLDAAEIDSDEIDLKEALDSLRAGVLHTSTGIVLEENKLGLVIARDLCHEQVNYPLFIPWGMIEEVNYFDYQVVPQPRP